MSSILKALRKLEEEKRGGKHEAPDLRVDRGRSEAVGSPFVPLVIGVVCGTVVVGLFFLWPEGSRQMRGVVPSEIRAPSAPVASQPPRSPQTVVEKPVVPATTKTLPHNAAPASLAPETPAATTAAVNQPVVAKTQPVTGSAAASQSKNNGHPDTVSAVRQPEVVAKQTPAPKAAELPAGISLLVTEIYYLGDVNSMAVVNDLPVMIGSHVDSAVVTEIQADRVLFEIDDQVYPVTVRQP
jgi:general secretion pathway protein B